MRKLFLLLILIFVFSGCSVPSKKVYVDTYSRSELLKNKENTISKTEESSDTDISGDSFDTVFITKTGKSYHTSVCPHLGKSKTKTTKEEAESNNLTPCSACNPDKQ